MDTMLSSKTFQIIADSKPAFQSTLPYVENNLNTEDVIPTGINFELSLRNMINPFIEENIKSKGRMC